MRRDPLNSTACQRLLFGASMRHVREHRVDRNESLYLPMSRLKLSCSSE